MAVTQLENDLISAGRPFEAGWVSFLASAFPDGCSDIQREELRNSFFAGVRHAITASRMSFDEHVFPEFIMLAEAELKAFIDDFTARRIPTEGGMQ